MHLEGFLDMDFALDVVDRTAGGIRLQASCLSAMYGTKPILMGQPQMWTPDDVTAAAEWFGRVAAGQEEPGGPHVWFGGGVCFGVIEEVDDGYAIDVLVMDEPDGQRPTFTGRFLDEDSAPRAFQYITVDARLAVLRDVADWWRQQAAALTAG
jgi:hypothetical protein